MSNNIFNDHRPTEMEEKAYAEARQHFAEHLKQFPASRDAVKHLERDVAKTALAVSVAVLRPTQDGNPILTDEDTQWHKCVDLFDNISVCHRSTSSGTEYAVVEHFPSKSTNEIWTRGRNIEEVLRAFTGEQRQVLQIWTEDIQARVKEFLAEKYPDQELSRVADSFMHKFTTQAVSQKQTDIHNQQKKHGHGIGI